MRRASCDGYAVMSVDPPWTGETGGNRAAPGHNIGAAGKRGAAAYRPMSLRDIMDMPVEEVAAADCLLGLWAPWIMTVGPEIRRAGRERLVLPPPAVQVALAWGFTPFHCVPWIKGRWRSDSDSDGLVIVPGMGNYVRSCTEALILCKRGSPRVETRDRVNGVLPISFEEESDVALLAPRGRHSQKPDVSRDLLRRLVPDGPACELFARSSSPGWDAWGNEAPEPSPRLLDALGAFWRDPA